jgi:hypothetical protein
MFRFASKVALGPNTGAASGAPVGMVEYAEPTTPPSIVAT